MIRKDQKGRNHSQFDVTWRQQNAHASRTASQIASRVLRPKSRICAVLIEHLPLGIPPSIRDQGPPHV